MIFISDYKCFGNYEGNLFFAFNFHIYIRTRRSFNMISIVNFDIATV